jgi:hypothetical protein
VKSKARAVATTMTTMTSLSIGPCGYPAMVTSS